MKRLLRKFAPRKLLEKWRTIKSAAIARKPGDLSGNAYRIDFKRTGFNSEIYFVPGYALHRPASRAILAGRYYEPMTHELIGILLKERAGDMIHAGAFFGDMLPSFSKKCPGRVFAFEPVLENYVLAKKCVEENALANVLLWNAALGPEASVMHVKTVDTFGAHLGGASRIDDDGQVVSVIPIDSVPVRNLSVLQLDVEGFELNALKGAAQTIGEFQPTILIEDNSNNCGPFLVELGYRPVGHVPGLSVWVDAGNVPAVSAIVAGLTSPQEPQNV